MKKGVGYRREVQLSILLLLFCSTLFAHNKGKSTNAYTFYNIQGSTNDTVEVTYSYLKDFENINVNYFIKEIAQNNVLSLASTNYTMTSVIHFESVQDSDTTYFNELSFSSVRIYGDHKIGNIDCKPVLLPEEITLDLHWWWGGVKQLKKVTLHYNRSENAYISAFTTQERIYGIEVEQLETIFADNAIENFDTYIERINSYKAAKLMMKQHKTVIQAINMDDCSSLPTKFAQLIITNNLLNIIEEEDFTNTLQLGIKEVYEFTNLRTSLNQIYRYTGVSTKEDVIKCNYTFYGLIEQTAYITVNLLYSQLEKSASVSPFYTSFIYKASQIDYSMLSTSFCVELLQESSLIYGFLDLNVIDMVGASYSSSAMNKGKQFVENMKYCEAETLLSSALNLDAHVDSTLNSQINVLLSESNRGVYDAYISVIRKSTAMKNYSMAVRYIKIADEYQKEHPHYIVENGTDSLRLALQLELQSIIVKAYTSTDLISALENSNLLKELVEGSDNINHFYIVAQSYQTIYTQMIKELVNYLDSCDCRKTAKLKLHKLQHFRENNQPFIKKDQREQDLELMLTSLLK